MTSSEVAGRGVARGTILNLLGQGLPLVVGLLALPLIVRGLGPESYGAFSVAWALLAYFTLFDFGLGRATTKFVAELHGVSEPCDIRPIIRASVRLQLLFASVGALLFAAAVPVLVSRVFHVSPQLAPSIRTSFYILALALPVLLVSATLSGVLEGMQRFDLVNFVRVPAGSASLILPVLALWARAGLIGVVSSVVITRVLALIAYAWIVVRLSRARAGNANPEHLHVSSRKLLGFGGWVAISAVISPLMVQMDRFCIGAVLSLTWVSYYSAPFDLIMRLLMLPSSLTTTLFPTFSTLTASHRWVEAETLLSRAVKYLLLIVGPIVLALMVLAKPGLAMLFGEQYATHGALVAQLLLIGVLINSLGWVPAALLQGAGRPDVTAKIHLLELPAYAALLWLAVHKFGIVGAAAVWVLRVLFDTSMLLVMALGLLRVSRRRFLNTALAPGGALLLVLALLAHLAIAGNSSLELHFMTAAVVLVVFSLGAWWGVLRAQERRQLRALSRAVMQR